MQIIRLIDNTKLAEGLKLSPYFDHLGVPSIGYGTSYWDGKPITMNWGIISLRKADIMLYSKLMYSAVEANKSVEYFSELDDIRQETLTEMAYQMGGVGLRRWKQSIIYINNQQWSKAHDEMLDSALYRDLKTKSRAIRYAKMILLGDDYE